MKHALKNIFPLILLLAIGAFLQWVTPHFLGLTSLQNMYIFYGIFTLLFAFIRTNIQGENMQKILLKESMSIHLIWLAFLTALGTLIVPDAPLAWNDLHRSPIYFMPLGYTAGTLLAYLMWNSLLYKGLKRWGTLLSHLGVIIIIVATALSFTFKKQGLIDLTVGSETSIFQLRHGNKLLPEFENIGTTVRLDTFNVDWSEPQVQLRLYKDGLLAKSFPAHEKSPENKAIDVTVDDIHILQEAYFSHLVDETIVEAIPVSETAEAALAFTLKIGENTQKNHLIAGPKKQGYIANQQGDEQVVFSTNQNVRRKEGIVYISARPLSFSQGESEWVDLELPMSIKRYKAEIIVESVTPYATTHISSKNDPSAPLNPSMRIQVTEGDKTQEIWLSPFMKKLQPLGKNWGAFLMLKDPEPTHFKSELSVLNQGVWQPYSLEVNKPLSVGSCRIYQGTFDRNNKDFSGLQVTCDPGRFWVKCGIWVMLFGTFLMILRRRLFKDDV